MSFEKNKDLAQMLAPFGKELAIQTVMYEDSVEFLRVRIKEGKRFTMLDLDPDSAHKLGELLLNWQQEQQ